MGNGTVHKTASALCARCASRFACCCCVLIICFRCYGYGGFSLYGTPEIDGHLGASEVQTRAHAPQLKGAAPRDLPRSARSRTLQCPDRLDKQRCHTSTIADTQCPFTQLDHPSGWCGTAKTCPDVAGSVCNNQGWCNNQGVCNCLEGWFGEACESKHCPGLLTQSGIGGATTAATDEYTVLATTTQVQNSNASFIECNGHGDCDFTSGFCHCLCEAVGSLPCFFGPECITQRCLVANGEECAAQGTCNYATGQCQCNQGFGGADCSTRFCSPGR